MSASDLQKILTQLTSTKDYSAQTALLSKAKLTLLKLKSLTPTPTTPPQTLSLARSIFEAGAIASISARDADAFVRYVNQLQPFYDLPENVLKGDAAQRSKVTGLYLLLLLTKGDYAGFHTELEGLMGAGGMREDDVFLQYPVMLERWLMEGSYDRVWKAMASGQVPSAEYGVFSEILTTQIRNEIASCSERAYPSLPIASTKNLLFLDSEGAVVQFANQRGWVVRDGRIYFPVQDVALEGIEGEKEVSMTAIENTLGYARELETIV